MVSELNLKHFDDVMKYKNQNVIKRISKDAEFSFREAQEIFEDTKRFLYLCATSKGSFVPSPNIDEGWHAFILHTKDYQEFCETYLGKFIHHYPSDGQTDRDRDISMITNTVKSANMLFGPLSTNWHYPQDILAFAGDCSDKPCNNCSNTSSCQSSDQ